MITVAYVLNAAGLKCAEPKTSNRRGQAFCLLTAVTTPWNETIIPHAPLSCPPSIRVNLLMVSCIADKEPVHVSDARHAPSAQQPHLQEVQRQELGFVEHDPVAFLSTPMRSQVVPTCVECCALEKRWLTAPQNIPTQCV